MIRVISFIAALFAATAAFAQDGNVIKLQIKNKETRAAVAEAIVTVRNTALSAKSGLSGKVEIKNVPDGDLIIDIFTPGYEKFELALKFPLLDPSERTIMLAVTNEVGEVTVNSTRTGREIEAEPTRVEAIDEEEIDEKISMRPGNVSMVLHESTGIQVQQTSATSNTQSVRIQGLEGRYTQILKDGFPAYGGFSGSLSILEIPPLDLQQVEVIKGPSATFYGAGAIAGVVNFISKVPAEETVTTIILNQTSALGTDFSIFNTKKYGRFGYTLLGSANYQREFDVDNDDFTELPRTVSFAVNPRLFAYIDDKTSLTIGNAFSFQKRTGGDVFPIQGNASGIHQYFENNDTRRNISTVNFDKTFSDGGRFNAKQSLAYFSRDLTAPNYRFKGNQFNTYTDLAYFRGIGKNSLVLGATAVYDRFNEVLFATNALNRTEIRQTFRAFVQDTVDLTDKLGLEAGFRVDHVKHYGTFALPRVSMLYRFTDKFTTRIGYGLGYKTPSVFTEEAEERLFRNVAGIGNTLKAERSQGGTLDFNYNGGFSEKIGFSLNQLFFYTQISDPLVLEPAAGGVYRYRNESSRFVSKGFETNAKFTYDIAKLFIGYTFTDARAGYLTGNQRQTLIPRHKINSSLVFEKAESFKGGVEFYYGSRQILDDRSSTNSTWEMGLFGEKIFKKFSLFINAENLFDERQANFAPVVLGPHNNPSFAQVWTHLEGRIVNGGIKIRL